LEILLVVTIFGGQFVIIDQMTENQYVSFPIISFHKMMVDLYDPRFQLFFEFGYRAILS
jgi:hypothetical protein